MIQANELRIGNLVFAGTDENDQPKAGKVLRIFDTVIHWSFDLKQSTPTEGYNASELQCINPIPLTPEVIERWCGFRNEGLTYSGYVFLKEVLSGFRLEQYDDYFMFSECGEDKACASRLKYLHQLQNAYYFLSNWQELEVNVPAIVA